MWWGTSSRPADAHAYGGEGSVGIGWTFSAYVARGYLVTFVSILALFFALIVVVDLINSIPSLLDDSSKASAWDALAIVALRAPFFLRNILPFIALFAALVWLGRLNRRLELVVARAAGLSVWQFLTPVLACALALGILSFAVINPLSVRSETLSRELVSSALADKRGGTGSGDMQWLRFATSDGVAILQARQALDEGRRLAGVTGWRFDSEGSFRDRLDAVQARYDADAKTFVLSKVVTTDREGERTEADTFTLPTSLTAEDLRATTVSPEQVGFWDLPFQAQRARSEGRDGLAFDTAWHALTAQPLLLLAMALLAATVSLRFARFGGNARAVLGVVAAGFALYAVARLILSLGDNGVVPAVTAAWLPALVATLLAATVMLYKEDG